MMKKIKKVLIGLICVLAVASSLASCDAESTAGVNNTVVDIVSTKYRNLVRVTQNWLGAWGYVCYAIGSGDWSLPSCMVYLGGKCPYLRELLEEDNNERN